MPQDAAPEIYAALDLGSNSFHLLIARFEQNKLIVLDAHKDMVRFAAGLDDNLVLSEQAQQTALESLRKMAERLRGIPRDHIRIVGTNTLVFEQATHDPKRGVALGLPFPRVGVYSFGAMVVDVEIDESELKISIAAA